MWQPGAPAATLIGLRYRPGQTPLLTREWTSDAVTGGVIASPVLSADGKTVYVNGRNRALWALDAANGKVKWSVPLGFLAQTPPSVGPDGMILAGGGPDARLTGVKDSGDHAEVAWRRGDISTLTTASQAGTDIAYSVTKDGDTGMALLAFDPHDGTQRQQLPATGSHRISGGGVDRVRTAAWSRPPATVRSTASRRSSQFRRSSRRWDRAGSSPAAAPAASDSTAPRSKKKINESLVMAKF